MTPGRQVVDLVHLQIQGKRYVVPDEFEAGMVAQMVDVALAAGKQVIGTDHLVSQCQQLIAQVRPQEPGPAGNQYALA